MGNEKHFWTTVNELQPLNNQQVSGLCKVPTNAAGLKVVTGTNLHPTLQHRNTHNMSIELFKNKTSRH